MILKPLMVGGALASSPNIVMISDPITHPGGSVTWTPPKRYDHPFDGVETIRRLPKSQVPGACARLFKEAGLDISVGPRQMGCAVYRGNKGTIIVIDKPVGGITPDAVIRHERGHLNGWPADHPD